MSQCNAILSALLFSYNWRAFAYWNLLVRPQSSLIDVPSVQLDFDGVRLTRELSLDHPCMHACDLTSVVKLLSMSTMESIVVTYLTHARLLSACNTPSMDKEGMRKPPCHV